MAVVLTPLSRVSRMRPMPLWVGREGHSDSGGPASTGCGGGGGSGGGSGSGLEPCTCAGSGAGTFFPFDRPLVDFVVLLGISFSSDGIGGSRRYGVEGAGRLGRKRHEHHDEGRHRESDDDRIDTAE